MPAPTTVCSLTGRVLALAAHATFLHAGPLDALPERRQYPPRTLPALDPTPAAVAWAEPPRLALPSDLPLATIFLTNRTFRLVRTCPEADRHARNRAHASKGEAVEGFNPDAPFASFAADDTTPAFFGSGRAGRYSAERLVIDGCVFIMDFAEGDFERFDPRRSGVYVEGYREVVVRNSVFLSRGLPEDPLRRTTASVYAVDCVNVLIENCWFGGRTIGWRGHVNLWGCGPSEVRNVEIDGLGRAAGGIWVATGVGEGKISFPHEGAADPSLTIYPPGPLRVENCWVHNQRGKENSDGIYVQSVRPFLIRNCKIARWQDDALVDVGFRDTSKKWGTRFLPNHGGLGVIEHGEFAAGYVKTSVGLAGGLIFRQNILREAWFFPYAFDGGGFHVVHNRFDPMARVVLSGRNAQTDGWIPAEGMLARGGRFVFEGNLVRAATTPAAVFVAGARPGPVTEVVRSDHNAFVFPVAPRAWAIEHDGAVLSLKTWRARTGNDVASVLAVEPLASPPSARSPLPGGLAAISGLGEVGLLGPVGVTDPRLRARAAALVAELEEAVGRAHTVLEAESLRLAPESTLRVTTEKRTWGGGVAWRVFDGAVGQFAELEFAVRHTGRYQLGSTSERRASAQGGWYQIAVNGTDLGAPFRLVGEASPRHGAIALEAGTHRVRYTLTAVGEGGGAAAVLDRLHLRCADRLEREAARRQAVAAVRHIRRQSAD